MFNGESNFYKREYNVVIIDDDAVCRKLYQKFLTNLNDKVITSYAPKYQIYSYASVEAFLADIRNIPVPDTILLDHELSNDKDSEEVMTGLEMLKVLKSLYKGTPIVMISGQNEIDRGDFIDHGADNYLSKMFLKQQSLNYIVEMYLRKKVYFEDYGKN